jgi:hypothetical protein
VVARGNGRHLMPRAIDGRGRAKEGVKRGNQGGIVITLTWHLYAEAGLRGVAVCSGERRLRGQARWRG